jgi:hypothetical protein
VRLDEQEHRMVQALAGAHDEPKTTVVRKPLKAAYFDRFGITAPPGAASPTTKPRIEK